MSKSKRTYEIKTVESVTHGVDYGGMGHGMFPEMKGKVKVGDDLLLESRGTMITGIMDLQSGDWYFRKTDEDLDREHQEFRERLRREREESLEKHREEWQNRTNALPWWVRTRIEFFQKSPDFAAEGWGYELCVAELAVLYFDSNGEDSDEVMEYSRMHGTSGNQHDVARALAKMHQNEESVEGTISALSPITGDPFYTKVDKG